MMTSKVLEIGKKLLGRAPALPSRGEIAVQEQMSIFGYALVTARTPYVPRTRGEIAVHEQARIIGETLYRSIQPGEPKTRGEVATQEQKSIFRQAAGTLTAETDAIQAFMNTKKGEVNHTE
jgi:hypothetical protein